MRLLFLEMSLVLHHCSSYVSLMFIIMFHNIINWKYWGFNCCLEFWLPNLICIDFWWLSEPEKAGSSFSRCMCRYILSLVHLCTLVFVSVSYHGGLHIHSQYRRIYRLGDILNSVIQTQITQKICWPFENDTCERIETQGEKLSGTCRMLIGDLNHFDYAYS